jgi:hypothetical protein
MRILMTMPSISTGGTRQFLDIQAALDAGAGEPPFSVLSASGALGPPAALRRTYGAAIRRPTARLGTAPWFVSAADATP